MSRINNLIAKISPGWALSRERALAHFEALKTRTFNAAGKNRRTTSWRSTSNQNNTIGGALDTLRRRSQDVANNTPYGRRALQAVANNTVGSGISLSVEGLSPDLERDMVKKFRKWANSTAVDFQEQHTFGSVQNLVVRTVAKAGNCFVIRRKTRNRDGLPFSLQILDGEHLDLTKNYDTLESGNIIRWGVEFSALKNGSRKIQAYWLYPEVPGESFNYKSHESVRFPAADVCHVFAIETPGQIIGVPWLSCGMTVLKDLQEFNDAELVKQKVAACFTLFVHDFNGDGALDGLGEAGEVDPLKNEVLQPGTIQYLEQGKDISGFTPPTNDGYEKYNRESLRAFAASLGLSYEQVSMDYSNVNFSSGRMGWVETSRNLAEWRNFMINPRLNSRIFGWWKDANLIAGNISAEQHSESWPTWTAPRREMLDPVKETNGIVLQLKSGLISYQEAVRKMGYDSDDIINQNIEIKKIFEKHGLKFEWSMMEEEEPPAAPEI